MTPFPNSLPRSQDATLSIGRRPFGRFRSSPLPPLVIFLLPRSFVRRSHPSMGNTLPLPSPSLHDAALWIGRPALILLTRFTPPSSSLSFPFSSRLLMKHHPRGQYLPPFRLVDGYSLLSYPLFPPSSVICLPSTRPFIYHILQ